LVDFESEVLHVFVPIGLPFESLDGSVDVLGDGGRDPVGEVVLQGVPALFQVLVPFHQVDESGLLDPIADLIKHLTSLLLSGLVKEGEDSFFDELEFGEELIVFEHIIDVSCFLGGSVACFCDSLPG
jgi:hypothetical protein